MFCTGCGRPVTSEMQFCPECGTKVNRQPYQGVPNTAGQPIRQVRQQQYQNQPYPGYQQPAEISPLKLAIGACLILAAIFYALYYFVETVPALFKAMKYMPVYCLFGLFGDLGFLVAMDLTIAHIFMKDPRHPALKAAVSVLIGAATLQTFSYIYLLAEGYHLKTPVMLIMLQIGLIAASILMLMNLIGSLQTNLITVPLTAAVALVMLIGMLITTGNTVLSVMGGIAYVLYFIALAMIFLNAEEPSIIPGRRADGLK